MGKYTKVMITIQKIFSIFTVDLDVMCDFFGMMIYSLFYLLILKGLRTRGKKKSYSLCFP